jgi:hypothetical protein
MVSIVFRKISRVKVRVRVRVRVGVKGKVRLLCRLSCTISVRARIITVHTHISKLYGLGIKCVIPRE